MKSFFVQNVTSYVTVSGISSGGFMAVQYQVALSGSVSGAGVIAGGPYYCAQAGYLTLALTSCMVEPALISVPELVVLAKGFHDAGWIDSLDFLNSQPVYLFSGTEDTTVYPGVMKKVQEQYQKFGVHNITTKFDIPAEHSIVTDYYGNECDFNGSPYINNCGYDTAGALLKAIHSGIEHDRVDMIDGNLFKFDQTKFRSWVSMADEAYAYIPSSCQKGEPCSIHLNFHGCLQNHENIGLTYVKYAGYNRWAESNNIIILYPQTNSNALLNQNACWDWWGYSGTDYPLSYAPQIHSAHEMVESLIKGEIDFRKI